MSDKPDLGNTRLNGFSEGLARGAKLTGRINRAISIGEEAMRQNGAAFDSHTRKNSTWDKLDPKEGLKVECTRCEKTFKNHAQLGDHLRAEHGMSRDTNWKENATYRLPSGWEVQPAADFKDADGKRPKWAKKAFYVLDGGTNPVGEGDTREAAIRDAYEKRLSGQDWGEKRNAAEWKVGDRVISHGPEGDTPGTITKVTPWSDSKGSGVTYEIDKDNGRQVTADAKHIVGSAGPKEKHNAGDDAFLGENWSGMDVDSGQAQEGLAPAEDVDVLANTREGVKRGARKYGSRENAEKIEGPFRFVVDGNDKTEWVNGPNKEAARKKLALLRNVPVDRVKDADEVW